MLKGLYTAHTGLRNEQNRMDIMANNLANASTVGFKKEGSTSQSFASMLAVKVKDASVGLSTIQPIGYNNPGVKIGENYTDYTQGSMRNTGNTYDLALSGDGFFEIESTNKEGNPDNKLTRSGDFTLNKEGFLVTNDGDYVMSTSNQRIQLNTNLESSIRQDGTIEQNGAVVARIKIVNYADYNYLEKQGETYFKPVAGATVAPASATVRSGFLEMSNVQVVSEMVNLINITRQYESNQKIMQTYDGSMEITVNQLGKL